MQIKALGGFMEKRGGELRLALRTTLAGLATCYAAALPFLPQTAIGDLFWAAVLFGGAALVQMAPRVVTGLARRSI